MLKCPNCMQTVTDDSEFCIFCGTKLPSSGAAASVVSSGTVGGISKKCKNGHEFEDPDLLFCPICGLPFDESVSSTPTGHTWKCSCGHINPEDNNFCESCSRAKERKVRVAPDRKAEPTFIPEGMFIPSEGDLIRRKKK